MQRNGGPNPKRAIKNLAQIIIATYHKAIRGNSAPSDEDNTIALINT